MHLKKCVRWTGWALVVFGVLGYLVGNSLAPSWSFSNGENLVHLLVGLLLLAAVYWGKNASSLKWLAILVGLAGVYFALYGWFVSSNYYGLANFEFLDNLIHLVIGVSLLWKVWGKKR